MQHRLLLLVLALLLGWTVGCDSGGDDGSSVPEGSVVATIDGQDFSATVATAVRAPFGNGQEVVTLTAASQSVPPTTLQISLARFADDVTTYSLTAGGSTAMVGVPSGTTQSTGYTTAQDGSSGSVVVTAVTDERIEGTFTFTAVSASGQSVEVADGAFHLRFQQTGP